MTTDLVALTQPILEQMAKDGRAPACYVRAMASALLKNVVIQREIDIDDFLDTISCPPKDDGTPMDGSEIRAWRSAQVIRWLVDSYISWRKTGKENFWHEVSDESRALENRVEEGEYV